MNPILEQLRKPIVAALAGGIAGLALGLLWGWVIQPVEWVDAAPDILRSDYQEDYLRMAIDSFSVNGDPDLAFQRWQLLGENAQLRLDEIKASPDGQDQAAINTFSLLMDAVGRSAPIPSATPGATDNAPASRSPYLKYGIIVVGVLAVLAVVFFAFRLLRPLSKPGGSSTPAMQAQKLSQQAEHTNFETLGLATPVTQSMTTYVLGDDLYDESFSIDSQAGEFMGEYGVGISETIGVGDPKKVTAIEVWLFDKNDIKTATKVLMTEHAYNDPAIRQRLEAKGELVLVEPQKQIVLETDTLQLLATIADMEYGTGPLPPSSYLERLTLELAVWPKEG